MRLGPAAQARSYRLRHVSECGSTNDLASQAAREGADRLWIVADHQSAGRGRNGRSWTPKPGNLYASVALRDPAPARDAPQIGFVAALAVHDAAVTALTAHDSAADQLFAQHRLTIKWPNDLLLDGAKTAGILAESAVGDGALLVVVGVGVNVADHPFDTPYPATHLRLAREGVEARDVFEALSDAFALRFEQWRRDGFGAIRDDWSARAAGLGRSVTVRRDHETIEGVFEGLDVDGRLVLSTAGARRLIEAGDVFLKA